MRATIIYELRSLRRHLGYGALQVVTILHTQLLCQYGEVEHSGGS
jgi:hypothetical protein